MSKAPAGPTKIARPEEIEILAVRNIEPECEKLRVKINTALYGSRGAAGAAIDVSLINSDVLQIVKKECEAAGWQVKEDHGDSRNDYHTLTLTPAPRTRNAGF